MNARFAPFVVGVILCCLLVRARSGGTRARTLHFGLGPSQVGDRSTKRRGGNSVPIGPNPSSKARYCSFLPNLGLKNRTVQFRTPTGLRRWIKRNTVSVKVGPLALALLTLLLAPAIAPVLFLCVVGLGRVRKRRALDQLRSRRSAALPDLVDMIRLCVASGCTPYGSLVVLGSLPLRADDVLGSLLVEVAEALQGGAVVVEVLDHFHAVVGEAARPLCVALRSSAELGTPIAETLDLLAREARRARKAQADVAAKRLPVLLLFPLITCILPAFALLAIVPLLGGALSALHW